MTASPVGSSMNDLCISYVTDVTDVIDGDWIKGLSVFVPRFPQTEEHRSPGWPRVAIKPLDSKVGGTFSNLRIQSEHEKAQRLRRSMFFGLWKSGHKNAQTL